MQYREYFEKKGHLCINFIYLKNSLKIEDIRKINNAEEITEKALFLDKERKDGLQEVYVIYQKYCGKRIYRMW